MFDTDREDVVVGDKVLITYQGQNIGVLNVESRFTPNKVGAPMGLMLACVLFVCV